MLLTEHEESGLLDPAQTPPQEHTASDEMQQLPLQVVVSVELLVTVQSIPFDVGVHENGWHWHIVPAAWGHPVCAQHSPGPGKVPGLHTMPFGDPTMHVHASPL
jgi:hypothetical protein